ncbi:YceD family protein [Neobacillus fumarioli]|uniref:YceD family protein n=1 Tax=Neobacillus fumarioli TaxID=105229 RepID=UPI00082B0682|nr:YceD family protein [Neobacillus fumarioli]
MKWTLVQLQKYRNKDFLIDDIIRVDEIKQIDPTIRDVSPIHITGRGDVDATKVTFHLKIEGFFILPCSRTLVDVKFPISVETTETFLLQESGYQTGEEVHQVKGEMIDLKPIIQEILLLEVPMQVFCDSSDSEDAAPQSGNDWEVVQEEENSAKIDPRLAGLAKFFDHDKSSSES